MKYLMISSILNEVHYPLKPIDIMYHITNYILHNCLTDVFNNSKHFPNFYDRNNLLIEHFSEAYKND